MKAKSYKIEKQDVEKLSSGDLAILVEFKSSPAFKLLRKLGKDAITRRALDAIQDVYSDFQGAVEHGRLAGVSLGIDFILDASSRAREELKERKEE